MANHFLKWKNIWFKLENDGHNRIDSHWFHVTEIFPKRKLFNVTHYIELVVQSILELRLESVRRLFVIYADNVRPHTARQSQEFYEQNCWELPISALLSWFGTVRFFYSDMWKFVWRNISIFRKKLFLMQFT
jgi:hypothetical protein